MAGALDVSIVIGGITFDKVVVNSINTVEEESVLGSELRYDTMEAVIYYDWHETGVDLRDFVYGTEVLYYIGSALEGRFFLDTISRESAIEYHLNCVSGIGLLDTRAHVGGLYTGNTLSSVLSSIIGSSFNYTVDASIANMKIYGWLPFTTARDNLRQLLFAQNVHMIRDENKNPVFTVFDTSAPISIPDGHIYNEGSEDLLQVATQVTVSEHSFYYLKGSAKEELFNNDDGYMVTNYLVTFSNAPIYVPSIEATDGLTIVAAGLNYAIVTGRGVLTGVPYQHKTFDVVRTGNPTAKDYEVSVTDVTLLSIANSANAADRLMEYYSSRIKISADLTYNSETCGKYYNFTDAFLESVGGFLSRIEKAVSSFIKAHCEFISNYTGGPVGNNYNNCVVLTNKTSTKWTVPAGVKSMRVILIGGGSGGESGCAGEPGSKGHGGRGGEGGLGGASGRIFQFEITQPAASYTYKCGNYGRGGYTCYDSENHNAGTAGEDTTFGSWSSLQGAPSSTGFCEVLISGTIYALPGQNGLPGGSGGDGGTVNQSVGWADQAGKQGEEIYWEKFPDGMDPRDYYGGAKNVYTGLYGPFIFGHGGNPVDLDIPNKMTINGVTYQAEQNVYAVGCGGGGGGPTQDFRPVGSIPASAAIHDGADGVVSYVDYRQTGQTEFVSTYETRGGVGGAGWDALSKPAALTYGSGGDGGYGGGGGGGTGAASTGTTTLTKTVYETTCTNTINVNEVENDSNAIGGTGGAGGNGSQGCVIIYY